MGVEINMYVLYKEKSNDFWIGFGGHINPGRNYKMFEILANVRNSDNLYFESKGLPNHSLPYQCENDLYYIISDTIKGDNFCTLEEALKYPPKIINDSKGNPLKLMIPHYFNHSWMSVKELSKAYRIYGKLHKKEFGKKSVPAEYIAVLDLMKSLKKKGNYDVEVVFWFDN